MTGVFETEYHHYVFNFHNLSQFSAKFSITNHHYLIISYHFLIFYISELNQFTTRTNN